MTAPFTIKVLEFSDMPHGRDDDDGQYNGQKFRRNILLPALKAHDIVEIDFEGVKGCGSSFADESFAGLITHEGFSKEEVIRRISYKYKYKSVIKNIYKYIEEAADKKAKEQAK